MRPKQITKKNHTKRTDDRQQTFDDRFSLCVNARSYLCQCYALIKVNVLAGVEQLHAFGKWPLECFAS